MSPAVDNIGNAHDKCCTDPDDENDDPTVLVNVGSQDLTPQHPAGVNCDSLAFGRISHGWVIGRDIYQRPAHSRYSAQLSTG